MSEPLSVTSSELLARLDARLNSASLSKPGPTPPPAPDPVSATRWSYRSAAAVLERFRPQDLRPLDPTLTVESPYALLFEDIQPASGGRQEQLFELKPKVRRASLELLGSRKAMLAALDANPDRWQGDSQALYEAWLRGEPPPLAEQTYRQLTIGREIRKWLDGLLEGLPSAKSLRGFLRKRDIVQSFEHLLNAGFVGREKELRDLREYVGVLPPGNLLDSLLRQMNDWIGLTRRPPLVIWAPGGTGKTALIGQFLSEHSKLQTEKLFPFAYLPLDNPALRVAEPYTLVVESVSQLRRQFPGHAAAFSKLDAAIDLYRDQQAEIRRTGHAATRSQSSRLTLARESDARLYHLFGRLLRLLALRHDPDGNFYAPAVLVIDTFEEAQYRDKEKLRRLWEMLGAVQEVHPTLRVVISGRAPVQAVVGGEPVEDMELGDLDAAAAVELLRRQGLADVAMAQRIVGEFGGNPLTLKLAARAVLAEPEIGSAAGLEGIKTRRYGIFALSPAFIRGQLYARILDHIHDPNVRKLAHPGMVLRLVTPDLIREVLAGPCGIELADAGAATALFNKLAREHAFVTLEQDGAVRYRPEIRQPMLNLLRQNKPWETAEIHRAAIDYYLASKRVEDRAEEMYHRLALDQEPFELADRWLSECGDFLAAAVEELPPRAVAWLASRLDLEVPRELLASADLVDWERNVARKVQILLRDQATGEALALLGERPDRSPASPLFALEARAHWLTGDDAAALAVLDRGLESSPATANLGRVAEMLWMKADTLRRKGDRLGAAEALVAAEHVAMPEIMPRQLCRLQVLAGLAEVLREGGEADRPRLETVRARLAGVLVTLTEADLYANRNIVQAALCVLGPDYPAALRHGLEAIGLEWLYRNRHVTALKAMAQRIGGLLPITRFPVDLKNDFKNPAKVLMEEGLQTLLKTMPDDSGFHSILASALEATDYSLEGANLAGIEEYREPWELEHAPEVIAAA